MNALALLVGLGNPGKEYEQTRHNFGFLAIDSLLETFARFGNISLISGKKHNYELWQADLSGKVNGRVLLMKPLTFMNKSGEAVQPVAHFYHIIPANILVLHDELDIAFGKMKLKVGGGNAGHNGLKSIQQHLGTPEFYRLRLGIEKPTGFETTSYVLGKFTKEQSACLPEVFTGVADTCCLYLQDEVKKAQQYCNSFSLATFS